MKFLKGSKRVQVAWILLFGGIGFTIGAALAMSPALVAVGISLIGISVGLAVVS